MPAVSFITQKRLTMAQQQMKPGDQTAAERRRPRTFSTKAVPITKTATVPMVNGAVIMAVNTHASGCTPAITRLKMRATATNTPQRTNNP